ncbi:MAG: Ldh family oxidoreductase, partial [Acidobacteria bacterium]|nr:Ldh family oxidoreductase [Acidobacteriota bacterium]
SSTAGLIVDSHGRPSADPNDFYGPPQGAILPFGGDKGYRGYALSLLVEILGGLLAGSSTVQDQPGNGLAFIVVDVGAFLPPAVFAALVREMGDYVKSSPPAPGHDGVLLPGEPDFRRRRERLRKGIPIDETTWEQIQGAARSLGVEWKASLMRA